MLVYWYRRADTSRDLPASSWSPVTLDTNSEGISAGRAVQVYTGSAILEGDDTVVMVEHTER